MRAWNTERNRSDGRVKSLCDLSIRARKFSEKPGVSYYTSTVHRAFFFKVYSRVTVHLAHSISTSRAETNNDVYDMIPCEYCKSENTLTLLTQVERSLYICSAYYSSVNSCIRQTAGRRSDFPSRATLG